MARTAEKKRQAAKPPASSPVQIAAPAGLMKPKEAASGSWPMLDEDGEQMRDDDGRLQWIPWVINPSDLYEADDPLVTGWPHLFKPAGPTTSAAAHPREPA